MTCRGKGFAPCKGIRYPESNIFLLMESGIQDFGIRNPASGIQNPVSCGMLWNPESRSISKPMKASEKCLISGRQTRPKPETVHERPLAPRVVLAFLTLQIPEGKFASQ